MLLVETQPTVGQLYGFEYETSARYWKAKTKKRLVLVERVDSDGIFGHDFLADGPRQFKFDKIKSAKNFTDSMHRVVYDTDTEAQDIVEDYESRDCLVYNNGEEIFAVNVGG